jgi:hypothetical protein
LALVTSTALLGLASPAGAAPPPLVPGSTVECDTEPGLVLILGHLHRWQMGLDDTIPGPC